MPASSDAETERQIVIPPIALGIGRPGGEYRTRFRQRLAWLPERASSRSALSVRRDLRHDVLSRSGESDHGAILAQRFPQLGYVERPRRLVIAQAHGRRHADRLAVGEALRCDARRCHGFMFSR
jgi:hypothetical protein